MHGLTKKLSGGGSKHVLFQFAEGLDVLFAQRENNEGEDNGIAKLDEKGRDMFQDCDMDVSTT